MTNSEKLTYTITKAALFGAATGDALGVPVEFLPRNEVRAINPKDMLGCDTPRTFASRWGSIIPAGAWSDDTSMAVAAMASIANNNGDIYFRDVMEQFCQWWENSEYSSLEFPFGLGGVVSEALRNYRNGTPARNCGPTGFHDNGNGALMRIFPFSLYCIFKGLDADATVELINTASGITHGHGISKMGCVIFTVFMRALMTQPLKSAWKVARNFDYAKYYDMETLAAYTQLLSPNFPNSDDSGIGETGYVVDCLKAAVWSLHRSHNYKGAILTAVGLGYDTDTNAAVTGALAGVYYGYDSIPTRWLAKLRKKDMLEHYAKDFAKAICA